MRDSDFEVLVGKLQQPRFPRFSPRFLKFLFGAIFLVVLLLTGFYTVNPEEIGIVQRFGAYVRSTDPGLHFRIPFGIERVTRVPIQRQLKEEFGFRTATGGTRTVYASGNYGGESQMLTGDLNAANVEWVVQYRVIDPYRYLFRVRNIRDTFRSMTEAVMRETVGDRTVNEVLTVGRQEVASQVELHLQALCDAYDTGIRVEQVVLQDVNPPDEVKPSFNEVNQAQQEREKLINQAESEFNRVIPRARGEAEQTIQKAEGYALDRVNRARGDSARFVALYESYRRAPEVTRRRIYLETMSQVLPKVSRKVIIGDDVRGLMPFLNLGEPAVGTAAAPREAAR